MSDPITFIITFVLRVAALVFLLRFVLQAVRASFYNPLSESIVRITDPVLKPLRILLPAYRNLDFAAFAMAWVAHTLAAAAFVLTQDFTFNLLFILNDSLRATLSLAIGIFWVAIVVTVLMSWLAPGVYSPAANITREIAEPVLAPLRKILPPIAGLDLSPMVAILVLVVVQGFVLGAILPYRLWPG